MLKTLSQSALLLGMVSMAVPNFDRSGNLGSFVTLFVMKFTCPEYSSSLPSFLIYVGRLASGVIWNSSYSSSTLEILSAGMIPENLLAT